MVNSLPGARKQYVKDDGEGTIEQDGDKGRNAGKVPRSPFRPAERSDPSAVSIGASARRRNCRHRRGTCDGLACVSLFTRGADVNIESGTQVEMVLQRPLILEDENLAGVGAPGSAPALVPSANQPKPMEKPDHRARVCARREVSAASNWIVVNKLR